MRRSDGLFTRATWGARCGQSARRVLRGGTGTRGCAPRSVPTHHSKGSPLQGANDYRLHVSANVPVKEFWSITAYDMATSAFFRNSDRLVVSSTDKDVQKNPDSSVDVYFGPKAPAGKRRTGSPPQRARTGSASMALRRQSRTRLEDAGHREGELTRFC
jgi:hypothetical protein